MKRAKYYTKLVDRMLKAGYSFSWKPVINEWRSVGSLFGIKVQMKEVRIAICPNGPPHLTNRWKTIYTI
jgi:hypothetical protein